MEVLTLFGGSHFLLNAILRRIDLISQYVELAGGGRKAPGCGHGNSNQSKISRQRGMKDENNANFTGGRGMKWLGRSVFSMLSCVRGCSSSCICISHDLQTVNPPNKWYITTEYMMQVEILMNNGQEDCSSIPITARSVGLPNGLWLSLSSAADLKILAYRSTLH